MKLISVIVPVYNTEKYIEKCVMSILNQTYKNLEIILIDDGSTDNSPQICDSLAEKDNRITVIHQPNGGVSSARNIGLDNTHGDYITFVNSDDYIAPNMIEFLSENIGDTNIAMCGYTSVDEKRQSLSAGKRNCHRRNYINRYILELFLHRHKNLLRHLVGKVI